MPPAEQAAAEPVPRRAVDVADRLGRIDEAVPQFVERLAQPAFQVFQSRIDCAARSVRRRSSVVLLSLAWSCSNDWLDDRSLAVYETDASFSRLRVIGPDMVVLLHPSIHHSSFIFIFSSHRQPVAQPVVDRPAVEHFGRQAQGHFQGVGAVVVIGDGELPKLLDQAAACRDCRP